MLKNRNFRREVVKRINKLIDLPFLTEKHEAQLITIAVDMCFDAIVGKVSGTNNNNNNNSSQQGSRSIDVEDEPPQVDLPEPGDEQADQTAKEKMIDDINAKVDIPGLNEEQEAFFIKAFVDAWFKLRGETFDEESTETS